MSAALDRVRRYVDWRDERESNRLTLGEDYYFTTDAPTFTLGDLREVVRMASEGVR